MRTFFDRILFLFEETFAGFRRNGLMCIAAISTAAVALILFGSFTAVAYEMRQFVKSWPDKFEMRVVMKNEATPKQIEDCQSRIESIKDIYGLEHQSKEQNWKAVQKDYQSAVGDVSDLDNPLPDTFSLKVKKLERASVIAAAIQKMPAVEEVQHLDKEEHAVLKITQFIKGVGSVVSAALFLAAMMLIYNAVRLTVIARRKEIRVMQLVGASGFTIRAPFILEAAIQGALGGVIAALVLKSAAQPGVDVVNKLPGFNPITLHALDLWEGAIALVITGIVLGLFCGTAAARKFLKA